VRYPRRRVRHLPPGGAGFPDDPHRVRLGELGLRVSERFVYDYDFTAGWRLHLRVEQIVAIATGLLYPRCVGGRRAGPPENWGGPWAFTERTQPHLVYEAMARAAEILGQLLEGEFTQFAVDREELAGLLPLLGLERFDRRALNQSLAKLAKTDKPDRSVA